MTPVQSSYSSQFLSTPYQASKGLPHKWKKAIATTAILCLTAIFYYRYSRSNAKKKGLQGERQQIKKIFGTKEKEISELETKLVRLRQKTRLCYCQKQQSQIRALDNRLSMNQFSCFIAKVDKFRSPYSLPSLKQLSDFDGKKYQVRYLTNLLNHNWVDQNKNNFLHIATQLSHSPIVRGLLQNKFPVNLTNNAGHTPLHLCIQAIGYAGDPKIDCPHRYQIFCDLVKHEETNVSLKDVSNCTPVNMIAKYGQDILLYTLLKYRLSRKLALCDRDKEGKMPFDYFTEEGNTTAANTIKKSVEEDTSLLIDGYCREQYPTAIVNSSLRKIIYEKYFLFT
ncbi:MAG: ankyrin repeat domain-containing protein [Chlamydiota bacterium]